MTERYTDSFNEFKRTLQDFTEMDKVWKGTQDDRMTKVEKTLAGVVDRIEEQESKAVIPGRTGAATSVKRDHVVKFCQALRGKFANPAHLIELENVERALGRKDVSIGTGSAGGFAVPEEISRQIERLELKLSPVRGLVRVVRTMTSDYKVLVNKRGTAAAWSTETGTRTGTATSAFRERATTHGELYAYPTTTEWALDDIFFDVEAWLAEECAQAFAAEEGDAVVRGNGSNKPTGMINTAPVATADFASPERDEDAYEAINSDLTPGGAGIVADSLIDLVYTVNSAYRANGTFVMNSLTAAAIRKLKDDNGQYLWGTALIAGQPDRLLGYPVAIWEDFDDIGSNKYPVAFGDFRRGYVLNDISELRILRDPYTTPGLVKFYVRRRVGGIVTDNSAVKFLKTI